MAAAVRPPGSSARRAAARTLTDVGYALPLTPWQLDAAKSLLETVARCRRDQVADGFMPGCVGQVTDVCGAVRHAGRSRSTPAGYPGRRMIEHDCNPAAPQAGYPVGEERDPDPPALEQGTGRDLTCQPYPARAAQDCLRDATLTGAELSAGPRSHIRSKIAAMPCPPPMHIVTSAYRPPVRRSSYRALTVRMAPVAPIGWPREMPLPFGLVCSGGSPSSRTTASACAANASFTSNTSMSSSLRPARSSTVRTAGTGPMPMTRGSTPACP